LGSNPMGDVTGGRYAHPRPGKGGAWHGRLHTYGTTPTKKKCGDDGALGADFPS